MKIFRKQHTPILSMAYSRHKIESDARNYSDKIAEHIINLVDISDKYCKDDSWVIK